MLKENILYSVVNNLYLKEGSILYLNYIGVEHIEMVVVVLLCYGNCILTSISFNCQISGHHSTVGSTSHCKTRYF